jgi:hypothetical protein
MKGHATGARIGLLVTATLLAATLVHAQDKPRPSAKKPAKNAKTAMKELFGVRWHTSVDAALKQASTAETSVSKEKPVMVLRVLGDIDGFM